MYAPLHRHCAQQQHTGKERWWLPYRDVTFLSFQYGTAMQRRAILAQSKTSLEVGDQTTVQLNKISLLKYLKPTVTSQPNHFTKFPNHRFAGFVSLDYLLIDYLLYMTFQIFWRFCCANFLPPNPWKEKISEKSLTCCSSSMESVIINYVEYD